MKQQSISTRLAALYEALELRRMIQSEPIDPLSASLFELARDLRGLDAHGLDAAFNGQNILNHEEFDRFVSDYSKF